MGCLPQAAWLKDFSPKSGRCGIAARRGALPMIDRGIGYRQAIDRYAYLGHYCRAGYGQFEHKADNWCKIQRSGRTVREIDV